MNLEIPISFKNQVSLINLQQNMNQNTFNLLSRIQNY
jgi:hypothetical protein